MASCKNLVNFHTHNSEQLTNKNIVISSSLYCGPARLHRFCERFTGDIAVVAHCKNLTCFDCRFSGGIFGKDVPTAFFLCEQVIWYHFCECSVGDIKTFENTPKITKIDLCHPSCVGKKSALLHPSFVSPSANDTSTNIPQVTLKCLDTHQS